MMWDFMWVPRAIKVRKRSLWDHVSLEGYKKEVNTDLVLEGRREYEEAGKSQASSCSAHSK